MRILTNILLTHTDVFLGYKSPQNTAPTKDTKNAQVLGPQLSFGTTHSLNRARVALPLPAHIPVLQTGFPLSQMQMTTYMPLQGQGLLMIKPEWRKT